MWNLIYSNKNFLVRNLNLKSHTHCLFAQNLMCTCRLWLNTLIRCPEFHKLLHNNISKTRGKIETQQAMREASLNFETLHFAEPLRPQNKQLRHFFKRLFLIKRFSRNSCPRKGSLSDFEPPTNLPHALPLRHTFPFTRGFLVSRKSWIVWQLRGLTWAFRADRTVAGHGSDVGHSPHTQHLRCLYSTPNETERQLSICIISLRLATICSGTVYMTIHG